MRPPVYCGRPVADEPFIPRSVLILRAPRRCASRQKGTSFRQRQLIAGTGEAGFRTVRVQSPTVYRFALGSRRAHQTAKSRPVKPSSLSRRILRAENSGLGGQRNGVADAFKAGLRHDCRTWLRRMTVSDCDIPIWQTWLEFGRCFSARIRPWRMPSISSASY